MKTSDLTYLLKYCSSFSIYVVGEKGKLIKIDCPFTVKLLIELKGYKKGTTFQVEELRLSPDLRIVYVINGNYFYYYHFDIQL